jgi:hypothetical protein
LDSSTGKKTTRVPQFVPIRLYRSAHDEHAQLHEMRPNVSRVGAAVAMSRSRRETAGRAVCRAETKRPEPFFCRDEVCFSNEGEAQVAKLLFELRNESQS